MADRYIVVDGSNIATEGRELPSLAQLDQAVRAFMQERSGEEEVIVVVDATFGHRIDASERPEFEQAERAGEIVSPPAGAIGRGDAFLLQVADRTNAVVLSNDSFQEFHAEHPWLFDEGRLVGGKPVAKVGWFFTTRTPVRGAKSREAIRAAKKAKKAALKRAAVAEGPVAEAIAEATAEAIAPELAAELSSDGEEPGGGGKGGRRSRRRRTKPVGAINDPLPFIQFIADHPLGSEVEGEVDSFTSHGAFVKAGEAQCYVPLSALGDPPPRSAKTVLTRGEVRTFVVQALDAPRRGIELAMPGMARVAGAPTEETVEEEIKAGRRSRSRSRKAAAEAVVADAQAVEAVEVPPVGDVAPEPTRPRRPRKAVATPEVAEAAAPEPVPARPRRARKAPPEVAEAAEAPAVKATRSRKKKAAAAEVAAEPAPVAAKRSRKAQAAAVAAEPEAAPAPAKRSRRKAAAVAVAEPPAVKAVRKRAAATKKAAAAPTAEEPPAPVKRSRKKSAG